MLSFAGTTALVTGASKGIGQSYARELGARGADLVLVARSVDALGELADEIRIAHRVQVDVVAADLFDRDAPRRIAADLSARRVTVDLLINNAGMGAVGPFLTRPFNPNVDSVALNISALMGLTHAFGAAMAERNRGGIINVASVAGFQPMPFQASYGATKAFVLSFTEALGEELRDTGVRVMAVHPGPVATAFFEASTAAIDPRAVSPDLIASKSLDDYLNDRIISFPGGRNDRATAFVSRLLSRRQVARLAGNFNRKAGHHHVDDAPGETTTQRDVAAKRA